MLRAAVKLASKASSSSRLGGSSLSWSRNYAAKEIRFGSEGRASMLKGVESLADAVRVTMGPKINYRNYTVTLGLNQFPFHSSTSSFYSNSQLEASSDSALIRIPQSDMEDDQSLKGDKLILRGLKFHGFHGVKPEERTLGQKFVIDVDAWLDLRAAGISDNLSDTVSYTDIYRIVKEVVEGEPQNLLESVVHKIAHNTFTKFSQISAVRVKVGKPHVAVHGQLDYLGVEILRTRKIDAQS